MDLSYWIRSLSSLPPTTVGRTLNIIQLESGGGPPVVTLGVGWDRIAWLDYCPTFRSNLLRNGFRAPTPPVDGARPPAQPHLIELPGVREEFVEDSAISFRLGC